MAGLAVDLSLYPIDTIKTRLQGKQVLKSASLFSSLYSGVSSVLIGSGPSSALFFTTYCLIKEKWKFSSEWKTHLVAAASGEVTACLIRVPVEVVKQRAQVHQNQSLMRIVQQTFAHEVYSILCENHTIIYMFLEGIPWPLSRLFCNSYERNPVLNYSIPTMGIFQGNYSSFHQSK